jgi:hypothetical protein
LTKAEIQPRLHGIMLTAARLNRFLLCSGSLIVGSSALGCRAD